MCDWLSRFLGRTEASKTPEAQPSELAREAPLPSSPEPELAVLVRDLESDSAETRERAVLQFLAAGAAGVPYLRQCLSSSRRNAAVCAAETLGRLGAAARPAVADLIAASVDRDARMRTAAATALPAIDSAWHTSEAAVSAAEHIVGLVWSLADSEEQVHEQTARELTRLNEAAVPALLRLMEAIPQLHRRQLDAIDQLLAEHQLSFRPKKRLSHQDFFVEATWKLADRRAAEVLRDIGKQAKAAVPMLISRIRSDDPKMRMVVAEALESIAPDDPAALEALKCLAQDKNDDVGRTAKAVLEQRGHQENGGE